MKQLRRFLAWLIRPRGAGVIFLYVFVGFFVAGSISIAVLGWNKSAFIRIVACALLGVSLLLLAYTAYSIVFKLKPQILKLAQMSAFMRKLFMQYGFRTIVFATGSMAVTTAYAVYNGVTAFMSTPITAFLSTPGSVWYAALALYYIVLTAIRANVIFHHHRKHKNQEMSAEDAKLREIKTYRSSGAMLIVLPLCLSVAVVQMALDESSFELYGPMIYVSAAYTFFKVVLGIIHLPLARKNDDMTVKAVRSINFADALVSLLALQSALLHEFSNRPILNSILNGVTGSVVCVFTLVVGIYTVVNANKKIKDFTKKMELGQPFGYDEGDTCELTYEEMMKIYDPLLDPDATVEATEKT